MPQAQTPLSSNQAHILDVASNGNGREVARLLGVSGNANFCDEAGETPLMHSIGAPEPHDDGRTVQLTAFEVLLPRSDLAARNVAGADALMFAARAGDISAIRALLPRSNLSNRANNGFSALHFAVEAGKFEAVELLASLFPVDDRDWRGKTPLHMTISARSKERLIFDLLFPLSNPLIADNDGQTPLMSAAAALDQHFFGRLLAVSDVSQTDAHGNTVLHVAAQNNSVWAIKRLLPLCDANALNHLGRNALMVAASFAAAEAAEILFAAPDARHIDHEGNDALILAFKALGQGSSPPREKVEKIAAFLAPASNPGTRNAQGEQALSLAFAAGMGSIFSVVFSRANDAEFESLARSALLFAVGPAAGARFEAYLLNQETRAETQSAAPATPAPQKRPRSL